MKFYQDSKIIKWGFPAKYNAWVCKTQRDNCKVKKMPKLKANFLKNGLEKTLAHAI